jgi:hypothetical protein
MGKRGIGIVIYGGEGLGKTSWATQWANLGTVKVISAGEIGFDDLKMVGEIPANCTNVNVDNFEELDHETINTSEDTLVIDSLVGVQNMIFDFVCRTQFEGNYNSFMDYWRGPRMYAPPVFEKWIDRLSRHLAYGRNVIIIGHMSTVTLPNTMGADYLSHVIALDDGDKGGMRSSLMRWAPNVLFLNIDVAITRATQKGSGSERNIVMGGKADDRDNRMLYTIKSPGHAAKNKLHLPPVINMGASAQAGFDNFIKALPKVIKDEL